MSDSAGAVAIFTERARQIAVEGYTPEHDARHGAHRLIDAALAYAMQAQDKITAPMGLGIGVDPARYWPWDLDSFRPNDDELQSLVKAGALLAAAYDAALARRTEVNA